MTFLSTPNMEFDSTEETKEETKEDTNFPKKIFKYINQESK